MPFSTSFPYTYFSGNIPSDSDGQFDPIINTTLSRSGYTSGDQWPNGAKLECLMSWMNDCAYNHKWEYEWSYDSLASGYKVGPDGFDFTYPNSEDKLIPKLNNSNYEYYFAGSGNSSLNGYTWTDEHFWHRLYTYLDFMYDIVDPSGQFDVHKKYFDVSGVPYDRYNFTPSGFSQFTKMQKWPFETLLGHGQWKDLFDVYSIKKNEHRSGTIEGFPLDVIFPYNKLNGYDYLDYSLGYIGKSLNKQSLLDQISTAYITKSINTSSFNIYHNKEYHIDINNNLDYDARQILTRYNWSLINNISGPHTLSYDDLYDTNTIFYAITPNNPTDLWLWTLGAGIDGYPLHNISFGDSNAGTLSSNNGKIIYWSNDNANTFISSTTLPRFLLNNYGIEGILYSPFIHEDRIVALSLTNINTEFIQSDSSLLFTKYIGSGNFIEQFGIVPLNNIYNLISNFDNYNDIILEWGLFDHSLFPVSGIEYLLDNIQGAIQLSNSVNISDILHLNGVDDLNSLFIHIRHNNTIYNEDNYESYEEFLEQALTDYPIFDNPISIFEYDPIELQNPQYITTIQSSPQIINWEFHRSRIGQNYNNELIGSTPNTFIYNFEGRNHVMNFTSDSTYNINYYEYIPSTGGELITYIRSGDLPSRLNYTYNYSNITNNTVQINELNYDGYLYPLYQSGYISLDYSGCIPYIVIPLQRAYGVFNPGFLE